MTRILYSKLILNSATIRRDISSLYENLYASLRDMSAEVSGNATMPNEGPISHGEATFSHGGLADVECNLMGSYDPENKAGFVFVAFDNPQNLRIDDITSTFRELGVTKSVEE